MNGLAVKAIRLSKGMTQAEFGESIGYSQTYLAAIEAGSKAVSDDVRIRIAQVYGTGDDIKEAITRAKESVNLAL